MRRFYASIQQFQAETVVLNFEETRHLRDVLRLKETAVVQVFDGAGREFLCEIQKIEKKETLLKIIKETASPAPESNLNLILAVALLKGEKFDLVVQKAVELGVTNLVPLNTKRADVRLKDTDKRLERWRKIALEAAKQSGRAKLMTIEKPLEFNNFIETANGTRVLFAERGGESFADIKETKKITAAVGAEGGWEAAEIDRAREKEFQIVTFKGRILRAETAAVSITAVLQHRFGDFV